MSACLAASHHSRPTVSKALFSLDNAAVAARRPPSRPRIHARSSKGAEGESTKMEARSRSGERGETGGEYPDVMAPRPASSAYLPGLTRSVYERDHAVITTESRVWCG